MKLNKNQALVDSYLSLLPTPTIAPTIKVVPSIVADQSHVDNLAATVKKSVPDLWSGNWESSSKYPSQSEADFALCGVLVREAMYQGISDNTLHDAVCQAFAQSGLHRSEKQVQIAKYAVPKLITSQLQIRAEFIESLDKTNNKLAIEPNGLINPPSTVRSLFNIDDGRLSLSNKPPPARDYVFADCIIPGTLSIFSGLGGTAKTTALMQIAVQGALGKGWNRFQVAEFSSALFLGEETNEERNRRIGAICKDFNETDRQKVTSRIRCYAAAGKDLRLTATVQNNLLETALAREVIGLIEAQNQESDSPVRLVVFDHARLVMSGDAIDAGDVTQLTRVLTDIAIKTHTAVVLLGHSPKSAIAKETSSDSSEIFGSTAFVDNARAAFVLHTMRENEGKTYGIAPNERKNYVCLTTVKANYGASNVSWWFKKVFIDDWQTIRLDPVMLYDQNVFSMHSKLSQSLIDLVGKHPAQLTERKIRERAGLKGELKASESSVRNSLNRLLEEGYIEKRAPTKDEVTQHKLSANVREILVLPPNTAG